MPTAVSSKKRSPKADPCDPMTGPQLRALRTARGWEQVQAAEVLCVPVATYRNWEQGRRRIPGPAAKLARLLFVK
jgi:DNA-binding transcriptional regulator YiaG